MGAEKIEEAILKGTDAINRRKHRTESVQCTKLPFPGPWWHQIPGKVIGVLSVRLFSVPTFLPNKRIPGCHHLQFGVQDTIENIDCTIEPAENLLGNCETSTAV